MARFTSYAMLRDGLDTGGLWSTSRGLARAELDYKSHLANCGQPRRNDLDGRGTLSEEALVAFARFFLEVSIDQVDFMTGLIEPEMLRGRILRWSEDEIRAGRLPLRASMVLEALLFRGELARAEVPELLATSQRHARRVTSALQSASDMPRPPAHRFDSRFLLLSPTVGCRDCSLRNPSRHVAYGRHVRK